MDYDRCYYDDEIRIRFYNRDSNIDGYNVTEPNEIYDDYIDYYQLVYANGRQVKVVTENQIFTYEEPILIISKPRSNLKWYCSKQPFYRTRILLHPNLFKDVKEKDDVLEFFYKLDGEHNVFKLNLPQFSSLKPFIDNIQTALFAHCGRFSIESRIKALISEINLIYETNFKEYIASTDSVPVQIVDYINKNFLEPLTLEQISNKFFVSKNTVNLILKKITGCTFKQYHLRLRLNTANNLIKAGRDNITTIAKLSGFSDYSSFIKAYKKRFGVLPSEIINKKDLYYPLK